MFGDFKLRSGLKSPEREREGAVGKAPAFDVRAFAGLSGALQASAVRTRVVLAHRWVFCVKGSSNNAIDTRERKRESKSVNL